MATLENIRQSLDEIGETLARLANENQTKSISVQEFHKQVSAFFPEISYTPADAMWDDETVVEHEYRPPWWDDLDEPFELDEFFWLVQFQKMDLLTSDEVRGLMNSIEAGVLAAEALASNTHKELVAKYGVAKFQKLIEIGNASFDLMITRNLKLVLHIARKYARRVNIEDAFSFGVFGLLQAVKKFDWRLGNQFSTYATWWLRQSLTREIADSSTTIDIPVHAVERVNIYKREYREFLEKEYTSAGDVTISNINSTEAIKVMPALPIMEFNPKMDITLVCALEASQPSYDFWQVYDEAPWLLEDYETPDLSIADFEYKGIAKDLSTRLTEFVLSQRELEVLLSRYGAINGEPQTLEEIGKRLGFTRERARQIEKKAILKMNVFLDGVTLNNYWETIEIATSAYQRKIKEDISLKLPTITREECGQEAGYRKHRERHEEPCQSCKKAHNLHKRNYEPVRTKPENKQSRADRILNLKGMNKERSIKASAKQVEQVRWALEVLKSHDLPTSILISAEARLKHPKASLSELANILGEAVTKDMVAGNLRRLIRMAVIRSGANPPVINQ